MKAEAAMEARTPGAKRAGPGEHVFDMHKVNQIMGGPGYSPVFGGCVEGERMIVALMRYPSGKPSDAHSHPNEQWTYVLKGRARVFVAGQPEALAAPGTLIYAPANVVHSVEALPDEDLLFFTVKDLSHGIVGTPAK